MLKARKYTLILDDLERLNLQGRDKAIVKRVFVDYLLEHKITKDQRFEIETVLTDAVSYGFIHEFNNGLNAALTVTTKGRNILKRKGLGWIFLAEYYLSQLTTVGALVAGLLVGVGGTIIAFVGVFK